MNNTHLSSRVGRLNLDWIDPDQSPEKENEAFHRAMDLAGSEFMDVSLLSQPSFFYQSLAGIRYLFIFGFPPLTHFALDFMDNL